MSNDEKKAIQAAKDMVTCFEAMIKAKNENIESLERIIKTKDEIIKEKDIAIKDAQKAVFAKIDTAIDKVRMGIS